MSIEGDPSRTPTPVQALALFAVVLATNIGLGFLLTSLSSASPSGAGDLWLLAATPISILLWVALAAKLFRVDVKRTLLLRLPSLPDVLMAIPLAISFVVLSDQISNLTDGLVPEEYEREMLRLLRVTGPLEWILKIATIGIGAAVSEELMFRGFIQTAFLRRGRARAVVLTSLLFMLIHGMLFPSIAAAGLVLGFTALATGSIVVPILIHFINNVSALALLNLADLTTLGEGEWLPPEILLPAVGIFVLTMAYYARRLAPEPASPSRGEATRIEPNEGGERSEEAWRLAPSAPSTPPVPTLTEELSVVPPERRRAGWLIVAGAVLLGSAVLLGLFVYSLYVWDPRSVHAAFIETLTRESRQSLAADALDRENDLASAFEALTVINEEGQLSLSQLFPIVRVYAEVEADGSIDSAEVDRMIAAIRKAVSASVGPRRL